MPRSRNIKPGLYKNEHLVTISFASRYMAAGLCCWADRSGRLEDRPLKIKMEMFPADDVDVHALLNELESTGFIVRYSVENNQYIHIVNFEKHQSPHAKEVESTLPAPDKHGTCTGTEVKGISNKVKGISKEQKAKSRFSEWWAVFPKKAGKKPAETTWNRIKPDADLLVADTLNRIANDRNWIPNDRGETFIPNPATYLNQERWNDEISRTNTGKRNPAIQTPADRNAEATKRYLSGEAMAAHG